MTESYHPVSLPPALVVQPGRRAAMAADDGIKSLGPAPAKTLFVRGAVLIAHASLTARRLGLNPPPRGPNHFDVLELYAFVRPARFCAPSAAGLALALGQAERLGLDGTTDATDEAGEYEVRA